MLELSLKIRDIPEGGSDASPLDVRLDRTFLRDSLSEDVDLDRSHVMAHLGIGQTDEVVQVRGTLEGEVYTTCVRCLGEARVVVDVPVHVFVGPEDLGAEPTSSDSSVSSDEEIEYFTHDGVTVELANVLREALILGIPMHPTCRPDCEGLCVTCGAPRDGEGKPTCDCPTKAIDPRFAALRDLKL